MGGGPFLESPFSASVLAPTPWKGAKNANWTLLFPFMYKKFITDGYFQNSQRKKNKSFDPSVEMVSVREIFKNLYPNDPSDENLF